MANKHDHFWQLSSSRDEFLHINKLMDLEPSRYNVTYGDYNKVPPFVPHVDDWVEWYTRRSKLRPAIQDYCNEPDAFDAAGTLRKKYRNDQHLTTLIIEDPTFIYDFFQQQGVYVSEKFRDTLLLPENSVEYVKLDDSQCPPELRAQKYMVMRVIAFRDVIDVARSDGFSDEHPYMRFPTPHEPLKFAFKDVEVDVPLFFDFRFPRTIATDAFAEKALRTGLTGFSFLGYNNPDGTDKVFYKTVSD